jgi:hypothetical protein
MVLGERGRWFGFLLRDRDAKFCCGLYDVFRSEGADVLLTPVQAPTPPLARPTLAQQIRKPRVTPRPYLLRGRLRCGLCQRCMQGHWVRQEAYYRCRYPAQYAIATKLCHPKAVYLREADLLPHLDGWIAELFDPANLDTTCAQLVSLTSSADADSAEVAKAHHVLRECDLALRRYRAALEQGANPETVGQWSNGATAKRAAAQQRLRELRHHDGGAAHRATGPRPGPAGRRHRGAVRHRPADRAGLYQQLGIELVYQPTERLVLASADLRWHIEGVGGASQPLAYPRLSGVLALSSGDGGSPARRDAAGSRYRDGPSPSPSPVEGL